MRDPAPIDVPGIELPFVHQAADVLVRGGRARQPRGGGVRRTTAPAPLAVADHLSGLGHRVTVTYRTHGPSPLVGKYTVGAVLARLDSEGARFEPMARLVGVEPGRVHLAHSYSNRRWSIEGVDSVVLACGAVPDNGLYLSLKDARAERAPARRCLRPASHGVRHPPGVAPRFGTRLSTIDLRSWEADPAHRQRAWLAMCVAAASIFLFVLDSGLLSIALPSIEQEFSETPRSIVAWTATGFLVTLASLLLIGGRLADARGRKRYYLFGVLLFGFGSLCTALAPTVPLLITARVIGGAGAAFLTSSTLALVLPEFPFEKRGAMMAHLLMCLPYLVRRHTSSVQRAAASVGVAPGVGALALQQRAAQRGDHVVDPCPRARRRSRTAR